MKYSSGLLPFPASLVRTVLPCLLIAFLMTMVANCHAASANAPSPPPTTAAWPKNFNMIYCWGTTDPADLGPWCDCAELTLHSRPRRLVDVFDCATGIFYPASGNWRARRNGGRIEFDFDGRVTYEGVLQPDGTYQGIMYTPGGFYGVWEGEYVP